MPLIERDSALDALPEISEIRPVFLESWDQWMAQPPEFRSKMTPTARAAVVHDLVIDNAARVFASTARIFDKSGLKLFVFGDICLRFKKHDRDLASRNQPTKQVKDFMGQRALDGVPAVYNLEAGYVLDPTETEIESTNLVCPKGHMNRPYWSVELHDEGYQFEVADLFDQSNKPAPVDDSEESNGSRWRTRPSGIVIPFKRIVK
ncbi:MAG: hypothetical protein ACOY82_03400 [Pseudomonadota bacterium]